MVGKGFVAPWRPNAQGARMAAQIMLDRTPGEQLYYNKVLSPPPQTECLPSYLLVHLLTHPPIYLPNSLPPTPTPHQPNPVEQKMGVPRFVVVGPPG